jgi:thiamine-phosphate pyrophosphorylase
MNSEKYTTLRENRLQTTGIVDFRLYLITDRKLFPGTDALLSALGEALKAGVRAVQLREKDLGTRELLEMARRLREITGRYRARLFINDRVDIALAVDADGVHLGGTGMPVSAVRKIAGGNLLIGSSAHSLAQAGEAEAEGADFITLGPVYDTPSKRPYGEALGPGIIKSVKKEISCPIFAIGGIKPSLTPEVLEAGAFGVALISGILASGDITTRTEEYMRYFND